MNNIDHACFEWEHRLQLRLLGHYDKWWVKLWLNRHFKNIRKAMEEEST